MKLITKILGSGLCLIIALAFINPVYPKKDNLKVIDLKTEYKVNPIGIDVLVPRLSWKMISDERNTIQIAYEIKAAENAENLKSGKALLWESKKTASDKSVNIEYAGQNLKSGQRIYWQLRVFDNKNNVSAWSDIAYWEMGFLKTEDWKAKWIIADIKEDTTKSEPCPYFRKLFNIKNNIKQARIYISGRGLFLAEINGKKLSDNLFAPGWTSYNKRLQYMVYDIKPLLVAGKNAIGVVMGDGWYRGYLAWENNRNVWGNKLALIAQIEVIYADGTTETIITDDSWQSNTGPILKSDIYNGETYDARLEKDNWSKPDYNAGDWKKTIIKNFDYNNLVAAIGPPVRPVEIIKPVKIFKTPKGETVVDMGQNMVGWIRVDIIGKVNTKITFRYAEVLDKNGNFYTDNLRSAKATDLYILKGAAKETFEPHFTFHGFRYVLIDGYQGELSLDKIKGIVIHSDMEPTGSFNCSDPMINQLQHNILWGLKGNFLDIPTDCPQRDERMGWTGDAQVFAPTASFLMNTASFFTKWLKDLKADQFPTGSVPWVIPDIMKGGGSSGWSDAATIIPWQIYLSYDDTRILKEQYESMKNWVNYIKQSAGDSCLWNKGWQWGDWLAFNTNRSDYPGATTDKDLISTAFYAHSTQLLINAANILGYKDDVNKYTALLSNIKKAFQQEYITPNGRLSSNTQTAYVLALAFDLIPAPQQEIAAKRLADDVKKFKHITTGFLGTPLICFVLSKYGYTDLAYMLLKNKKYPSWLYPVTMGATTIWERWDGIKPDSTFQDIGMNSFNHYAYGAIGNWMYNTITGIQINPEAPGYKKFVINPHIGGDLSYANAEYNSVYGKIKSSWNISGNELNLNISIPANTNAEVHIPAINKDNISEKAMPISYDKNIKFKEYKNGKAIFFIGSGDYSFKTKL
ncbi:MAG: glycoside hydrolase family 78 protein [Bacteroidales bacterium]|nr:glycoside hydrolase family 78 protein [Bacteroidales bacterium]